ncbi:MAG TPA: hypothetical protein VHG35_14350 [Gemmatimonadales bacterium]|nr:hypothetical protein [Gemmatimonadales bacterium]
MPTNKDLKRLVRARMRKTGEAYTAARARLLRTPQPSREQPRPIVTAATPRLTDSPTTDYAALAGISDAAVAAKTGCTWDRWVRALDHVGAQEWSHRAIAEHVRDRYQISPWWVQGVTVGYERIKGLRAIGQRRSGEFEANKSKVFAAPVGKIYRAFRDARSRRRWLGDVKLTVRTAVPDKSMRVTWPDGTSVELYFVAKGAAKSQVAVQHGKLPDRASVDRMKAYWTERLAALAEVVSPSVTGSSAMR